MSSSHLTSARVSHQTLEDIAHLEGEAPGFGSLLFRMENVRVHELDASGDQAHHLEDKQHTQEPATLPVKTLPSRREPILPIEWERLRSVITMLYVEQEMKLKDLVTVMNEQHSFQATEQMYKKRFTAWGLRKNYCREQKEAAIALLDEPQPHEGPSSSKLLNSKPLKLHKIHRHRRERRKLPSRDASAYRMLSPCPLRAATNIQPSGRALQRLSMMPAARRRMPRIVRQPHMIANTELFLILTEKHYDQFVQRRTSKFSGDFEFGPISTEANPSDMIWYASRLLEKKDHKAYDFLQRGCDIIAQLISGDLEVGSWNFPFDLLYELARPSWDHHPAVRHQILQFAEQSAAQRWGKSSPITSILSMAIRQHGIYSPPAVWGQLILDVTARHTGRSCELYHERQMDVVHMLLRANELYAAGALCRRSVMLVEQVSPLPQTMKFRALSNLTDILCLLHSDDEAKAVALRVYQLALEQEIQEKDNGAYFVSRASEALGNIYEGKEHLELSAMYYRLALDATYRHEKTGSVNVLRYLESLERVLIEQASMRELRQLQVDYAHVLGKDECQCERGEDEGELIVTGT